MGGGGAVQSDLESQASSDDRLHHHGTVSADAIVPFGDPWNSIVGFGSLYPFPVSGLALDASALDAGATAPAGQATNASAITSGAGGTSLETQGQGDPGSGLVIIADYDSSITDLPPTQYDAITGAITAAIDFYEAAITTPITITIDFGFGELGGESLASGALSESLPDGFSLDYSDLVSDLEAHGDPASDFPGIDPGGGTKADYFASQADLAALAYDTGSFPGGDVGLVGDVGLSSAANFTYDPNNRAVSGEYDAVGALEHEISEVMGRVADYGADNFSPLDLFRYTSPGAIATDGTAAYFSIDGGKTNLDAFNNDMANDGDAGDWSAAVPDDSYDAFSNPGVANTVSATDLTVMDVLGYTMAAACYAAGTRILTHQGEVRIEDLAVGDMVQARFAGLASIKWIGHRRIDCRRHPDPHEVWPVRIVAGAFGPDQPCRDLFLSPDHAVAIDSALVPIRLLINGASIHQETEVAQVHYFHIELDRHDLLQADGLAAESYLETGNRGMFANADASLVLHPLGEQAAAQQQRETRSCLPLLGDPARVESVWRALAARAERLGMTLPVVATTHDPALCIASGTMQFAPIRRDGGRYTFSLPALPDGARLRSRYAVPAALRPWLEDRRRLGVMVRGIVMRCGTEVIEVAPDHACLADGWWAAERDAAAPWRWTNGDAALPPINDVATLEVVIGDTPPYPLAEPACAGQMAGGHPPVYLPHAPSAAHEPGNHRALRR
jgi:hypothetical protein